MIKVIKKIKAEHDKNLITGYFDNDKNQHLKIDDTYRFSEMIVNKLNELTVAINKLGGKKNG